MSQQRWVDKVRPREPGQKSFIIDHPAGWAIMPVHYTMFEASTPAWIAEQKRIYFGDNPHKTSVDWEREMDINMELVSGVRCYPSFRWEVNTRYETLYDPMRPIKICCDFNVAIKAWPLVQQIHGRFYGFDEIAKLREEATIPKMVAAFRLAHPAHPGGVEVYGDATGNNAGSGAENESLYDLMSIGFSGYPSPVTFHVPPSNPPPKLRMDSINAALVGIEGEPILILNRLKCHYTIADLLEVVFDKSGKKEQQITDIEDPKHLLSHASSGLGYMMAVCRPVSQLAALLRKRAKGAKRVSLHKGRRLGRL